MEKRMIITLTDSSFGNIMKKYFERKWCDFYSLPIVQETSKHEM